MPGTCAGGWPIARSLGGQPGGVAVDCQTRRPGSGRATMYVSQGSPGAPIRWPVSAKAATEGQVVTTAPAHLADLLNVLRGSGGRDMVFTAMTRLREIGTPAAEPLGALVTSVEESASTRARALEVLASLRPAAAGAMTCLIDRLANDPDVQVRWTAAYLLGRCGDISAATALRAATESDGGEFEPTPGLKLSVKDAARVALQHLGL